MSARAVSALDIAIAAGGAAALIANGLEVQGSAVTTGAILVLSLVTAAPLAWRRRAPIATLLLVGAGLLACIAVFEPYWAAIAVAMVALYTVAVQGDRRRSLIVGAITGIVLVVAIALLEATGTVREGSLRLLLVLGALVVGDAVRTRRALGQAVADRRKQAAQLSLDEERLRIARELHDTVAHALVAINVRAGVAAHLEPDGSTAGALTDIQQVASEALHDLRATLDVMREPGSGAPTRPAQDLSSLPELFARARAGGLDAELEVRIDGTPIAAPIGQAAFRIVQESLTNVLRHAHATRARGRIRVVRDMLEIEVTDNGHGGVRNGTGHGLTGMAERADALGGHMVAGPTQTGGWRVNAQLPLVGGG